MSVANVVQTEQNYISSMSVSVTETFLCGSFGCSKGVQYDRSVYGCTEVQIYGVDLTHTNLS